MIKQMSFVRRKRGVTPEQFHTEWREHHQHFFASAHEARQLLIRSELNHRLRDDYARHRHSAEPSVPEWDGVLVEWFEDLEHLRALYELSTMQWFEDHALARYRTADTASVITHDATTIIDKPGGRERARLKLMCIFRRNSALDLRIFHEHWREVHGGFFKNIPELNEPILAYDQNHGLDLDGAQFDGLTEQWAESLPAWVDSLRVSAVKDVIDPDVAYLLDKKSTQYILAGKATVVVDSGVKAPA